MKINLTGVLILLVVVLAATNIFTFNQSRANREEAIRWESNAKEQRKQNALTRLTIGEFKDQLTHETDSIIKSIRVKPKNITHVTKIIERYTDTVYVTVPTTKVDTAKYAWKSKTKCVEIEGLVDLTDEEPTVTITKQSYNNDIYEVAHVERRKWKFLFFKTKLFGKKEGKLKVINGCGDVTWKKIDIVKD